MMTGRVNDINIKHSQKLNINIVSSDREGGGNR